MFFLYTIVYRKSIQKYVSGMPSLITKLQKIGQRRAGAGWNKHVTPWQRRKAKKKVRRVLERFSDSIS